MTLTGMVVSNIDIIKREVYSSLCLMVKRLTNSQEKGSMSKFYFLNGILDVKTGAWEEHNEENSTTFALDFKLWPRE